MSLLLCSILFCFICIIVKIHAPTKDKLSAALSQLWLQPQHRLYFVILLFCEPCKIRLKRYRYNVLVYVQIFYMFAQEYTCKIPTRTIGMFARIENLQNNCTYIFIKQYVVSMFKTQKYLIKYCLFGLKFLKIVAIVQ